MLIFHAISAKITYVHPKQELKCKAYNPTVTINMKIEQQKVRVLKIFAGPTVQA